MNLHTGRVRSEWQSQTPNPWKPTLDRYGNLSQRFGGGSVLDGLAGGHSNKEEIRTLFDDMRWEPLDPAPAAP